MSWESNIPLKGTKIKMLNNGKAVKWEQKEDKTFVYPDKKTMDKGEILTFSFQINK